MFQALALCQRECDEGVNALNISFLKYMAELIHTEKELSDWFPERSEFSYMDR